PRRSTQTMIGVTLSIAPTTMAIFSSESPTSTLSMPAMRSRAYEHFLARQCFGDAAENLQIRDGLPLRRIRGVDLLHASLQIGERAFLFRVDGRGEKHIGQFVQRM